MVPTRALSGRIVAIVCTLIAAASLGTARAQEADTGAVDRVYYPRASSSYDTFFRLVNLTDGGKLFVPPATGASCVLTGNPPAVFARRSVMQGVCMNYVGVVACAPDHSKLWWTVLANYTKNFEQDQCCRLNVERFMCFITCSPLASHFVRGEDLGGGVTSYKVYVTPQVSQHLSESCSQSCSGKYLKGPAEFLSTMWFKQIKATLVVGPTPDTGIAMDMDILRSCAAGNVASRAGASSAVATTAATMSPSTALQAAQKVAAAASQADVCPSCYEIAFGSKQINLARNSSALPSWPAEHQGFCTSWSSERSGCCLHDMNFTWPNLSYFPYGKKTPIWYDGIEYTAALECTLNIKRIQCACLCQESASFISGDGDEPSTCFVHPDDVERLFMICHDILVVVKPTPTSSTHAPLTELFPDSKALFAALDGYFGSNSTGDVRWLHFEESSERGMYGVVGAPLESACISDPGTPSGSKSMMCLESSDSYGASKVASLRDSSGRPTNRDTEDDGRKRITLIAGLSGGLGALVVVGAAAMLLAAIVTLTKRRPVRIVYTICNNHQKHDDGTEPHLDSVVAPSVSSSGGYTSSTLTLGSASTIAPATLSYSSVVLGTNISGSAAATVAQATAAEKCVPHYAGSIELESLPQHLCGGTAIAATEPGQQEEEKSQQNHPEQFSEDSEEAVPRKTGEHAEQQ